MKKTDLPKRPLVSALATTVMNEEGHYLQEHLGPSVSLKYTTGTLDDVDADELASVDESEDTHSPKGHRNP